MNPARTAGAVTAVSRLRLSGVGGRGVLAPSPPPPSAMGAIPSAAPVMLPALIGAPAKEIAARAQTMHLAFLIDMSGSMFGAWGGDPTDVCGAAAHSLLTLAGRSGGGTATIIPWGTTAPAELVTGPVQIRKNQRILAKGIRHRVCLGGNDLPAALQRLVTVAPRVQPGQRQLTFVLTDGIEDVTPALHHALGALPANSVHMTLIDRHNGCTPDMEQHWRDAAFASVHRVTTLTPAHLAATLGQHYATALGLTLPTTPSSPLSTTP